MIIGCPPEKWIPFGGPAKGYAPLLGVELELGHEQRYDEVVLARFKERLSPEQDAFLGAAMYDGSVEGAEFCTSPATLSEHHRMWPGILQHLGNAGFRAYPGCGGLHVHVSRKGLLPGQLELLVALILFGGSTWESLQEKIQGRAGSRWAEGVPVRMHCPENLKASLHAAEERILEMMRRGEYSRRYSRLNLLPFDTVEFRQGHATMNPQRLLSRVEFADAMLQFTHAACAYAPLKKTFPHGLPAASAFISWVRRRGLWPNLAGVDGV